MGPCQGCTRDRLVCWGSPCHYLLFVIWRGHDAIAEWFTAEAT